MTNSADPDQLASLEANWSGSTLFAKVGYIWDQHNKGLINTLPWSRYDFNNVERAVKH